MFLEHCYYICLFVCWWYTGTADGSDVPGAARTGACCQWVLRAYSA